MIADDRYSARDALELIDVEYELLPPVVDPRRALEPDAPLIRDDKPGQADNRIFDWESGDQAATDRVFAQADVVVEQDLVFPRSHPAPMETCGAVAQFDQVAGKLTVWCTTQAPHAHRTVYALLTGLPEHKIRVVSPDVGGGFGNKVPVYPGYVCAIVGAIDTGRPVKWMEDRSENLMSTAFARDYAMRGAIAATARGQDPRRPRRRDRRPRRVQRDRPADQLPGRVLPRVHRLLRHRGGPLSRHRRVHDQGARRRRVRLLVPDRRGGVPRRAAGRLPRLRARNRPRRAAAGEPDQPRPVPLRVQDRLGLRLRRLRADAAQGARDRRLRRAPPRAGRASARAAS